MLVSSYLPYTVTFRTFDMRQPFCCCWRETHHQSCGASIPSNTRNPVESSFCTTPMGFLPTLFESRPSFLGSRRNQTRKIPALARPKGAISLELYHHRLVGAGGSPLITNPFPTVFFHSFNDQTTSFKPSRVGKLGDGKADVQSLLE